MGNTFVAKKHVSEYVVLRGDPERRRIVAGKGYLASSAEEAIRMWENDTVPRTALEETIKEGFYHAPGYYTCRWNGERWVEPRWFWLDGTCVGD